MKNSIELSISIVNTNNRSLLRDCLISIYETTEKITFKIIVIDNASTDGSVDMLRDEFPSVRVLLNPSRQGYGYSHNKGILASTGQYVLIFNEDMIVLPHALERMVEKIKKDPEIGALGCKLLNPDGSLQHSCSNFPSISSVAFETFLPRNVTMPNSHRRRHMYYWDHDKEMEVDIIMGSCMLIPKSIFDKIGHFDTQFFVYSEEDDLCKRIKNNGYKVVFMPEAQIIHIGGQTSKTMSIRMYLVMIESKIKYFKKHHGMLASALFKLLTGIAAIIRLIGWTGYWILKNSHRQETKGNMIRYTKTLVLLTGLTKP